MTARSKASTFSSGERDAVLAVKGVGPTVIARLEQMGITTLRQLAGRKAEEICAEASAIVGSTCWKNSPQAKQAISAAIEAAKSNTRAKV